MPRKVQNIEVFYRQHWFVSALEFLLPLTEKEDQQLTPMQLSSWLHVLKEAIYHNSYCSFAHKEIPGLLPLGNLYGSKLQAVAVTQQLSICQII